MKLEFSNFREKNIFKDFKISFLNSWAEFQFLVDICRSSYRILRRTITTVTTNSQLAFLRKLGSGKRSMGKKLCSDVTKAETHWSHEVDAWECATKCTGIYTRDPETGSSEITRDTVILNPMGCKILNHIQRRDSLLWD